MSSSPVSNMVKGAVGIAGKNMIDNNPKLKKKANKAMRTVESIVDTAQYMFK